MADRISFELVSPDRLLMSAQVEAVMVPGGEGDFTVMPGHMPVISTVRPAVVDVYDVWGNAPTARIFERPAHPYTARLIASTPAPDGSIDALSSIPGNLPDLRRNDLPPCRFHARCDRALPRCMAGPLPTTEVEPAHDVRCFNPL